ncbi:MAG: methyltransferase domain-containing protein [Bacillota bacterium]
MIKCNLCGGTQFESVYQRNELEIITIKETFKIDIDNVICKTCGLVFQNPPMNKEKLMSFYKYQYRYNEKGESVRHQQKDYIEKFLTNKKGKILDIGSFEGYFLNLFKVDGWETLGVEPSVEGAKICIERYGIKVYNDMFENLSLPEKEFDVISIRHVLEHVDDAFNTIMLMKKYLKDEGIIFIEVPNIENFDYYNIADAYDFQHIFNFSRNTIKNYLNKCGLEIIDFQSKLAYAGMRFICKKGKFLNIKNNYEVTKNIVLNYKKERQENLIYMNQLLTEKNREWEKNNSKIYIYGAGFHTAQLFQYVINNAEFNIVGLIDMDEKKEGKDFFGYKTYNANKLNDLVTDIDVIIISSYAFQEEIYKDIKPLENKGTEIVKLYKETYAYDKD